MPKILDRLVGHLEDKGKSKASAFAIAHSVLERAGEMKGNTLTPKGKKRDAMGPAGRAKDRKLHPGKRV